MDNPNIILTNAGGDDKFIVDKIKTMTDDAGIVNVMVRSQEHMWDVKDTMVEQYGEWLTERVVWVHYDPDKLPTITQPFGQYILLEARPYDKFWDSLETSNIPMERFTIECLNLDLDTPYWIKDGSDNGSGTETPSHLPLSHH